MAHLDSPKNIFPVNGICLSATCAGIKSLERNDLVLIELPPGAETAGVFTKSAFCAAPVIIAKQHLTQNRPRYLLINSGNANAGVGTQGLHDALACCQAVADAAGCAVTEVLPFSTGVIGETLPLDSICQVIPQALKQLQADAWMPAAMAIMTTDTMPKVFSRQVMVENQIITITGMAKGAGMICPNMATMLAFIAIDMTIEPTLLQECLHLAVEKSFNRITVDGDTSSNDACVLMATGNAKLMPLVNHNDKRFNLLFAAIADLFQVLAQAIIRDAEGATKFVTIDVTSGRDTKECDIVAFTVAHSPLVKTALFASDPNWGRLLAAVGRAAIPDMDISLVSIYLGNVRIVQHGVRAPEYSEQAGQTAFSATDINVRIDLGRGNAESRIWTSDLSYDYVRINAEYRT